MKVYTTYFGNIGNIRKFDSKIVPVAVCRWKPRGWHGDSLEYLAPTEDMLNDYRRTKNWEHFAERYKEKILANLDPEEVIADLRECSRGTYDVALVCYEKSAQNCHRSLLANWLTENCGIVVEELNVG